MQNSLMDSVDAVSARQVSELLNKFFEGTDCTGMTDDELSQHRKEIVRLQIQTKDALAKTSRKELVFDVKEISNYIDDVLQRGYDLIETNPGYDRKLNDAQTTKKYSELIRKRVKVSPFGEAQFQIAELSVQRWSIERSKTLHELRQNIKAMIPVLKLYRDKQALHVSYTKLLESCENSVPLQDHEAVLLEYDELQKLCDARKYALDGIVDGLYQPAEEMSGEELLKEVDDFKRMHQCSDAEAAKAFGTNRTKITRLRKLYQS